MNDKSYGCKEGNIDCLSENLKKKGSTSSTCKPLRIMFLTLGNIASINDSGIYSDFIRTLIKRGHIVNVVQPYERKERKDNRPIVARERNYLSLNVRTLNITGCTMFEKGIAMLLIERQFISAIKSYLRREIYDLVVYTTPPVTFARVVRFIKKKYGVKSYLLLKDIFPQNAVDLGIIREGSVLHRYFRKKEIDLYNLSDLIGCMSKANREYLLRNNSWLDIRNVKLFPNALEVIPDPEEIGEANRRNMRNELGISNEACVFIMGGNFGKPQDIDFLLSIINKNIGRKDRHFIICGSGAEFSRIKDYSQNSRQTNLSVINKLSKREFHRMLQISDVGMICLNHKFTIPNYPSRILDYFQYKLPIIAFTDEATDLRETIEEFQVGWWSKSDSPDICNNVIDRICESDPQERLKRGINGNKLLNEHFNIENVTIDFLSDVESIIS